MTQCKLSECTNEVLPTGRGRPKSICNECHDRIKHCFPTNKSLGSVINKMHSRIKHRCQESGREFNIDYDDIYAVWPMDNRCPVFGTELVVGNDDGRNASPSLDRIDSNLGYVKGNLQICSTLANRMKQNADTEQLLVFANYINKQYGER